MPAKRREPSQPEKDDARPLRAPSSRNLRRPAWLLETDAGTPPEEGRVTRRTARTEPTEPCYAGGSTNSNSRTTPTATATGRTKSQIDKAAKNIPKLVRRAQSTLERRKKQERKRSKRRHLAKEKLLAKTAAEGERVARAEAKAADQSGQTGTAINRCRGTGIR